MMLDRTGWTQQQRNLTEAALYQIACANDDDNTILIDDDGNLTFSHDATFDTSVLTSDAVLEVVNNILVAAET